MRSRILKVNLVVVPVNRVLLKFRDVSGWRDQPVVPKNDVVVPRESKTTPAPFPLTLPDKVSYRFRQRSRCGLR